MLFPNNQNERSSAVLLMTWMCVHTYYIHVCIYAVVRIYTFVLCLYIHLSVCVHGYMYTVLGLFLHRQLHKMVFLLDCLGFISNPPFTVWTWQGVNTHYICFLLLLYHKRSGLQKHKMDLHGLKSKFRQGFIPSGCSGGKSVFLPSQILEAACILWIVVSCISKASNDPSSFSHTS